MVKVNYNELGYKLMKKADNVYKRIKTGSLEPSEMEDLDNELSRFVDGDYKEN